MRARGSSYGLKGWLEILLLVASVLAVTSCGASRDEELSEKAASDLRTGVFHLRDGMADDLAACRPRTFKEAEAILRARLPGAPRTFPITSTDKPGAEVSASVQERINDWGPGGVLKVMQVCVSFSVTTLSAATVDVSDIECPTNLPTVDFTIELEPQ